MSQSIDQSYLKEYSLQFTKRICSAYFDTKQHLVGEDIMQLTPSKQVNLMIIKSLFMAWQTELEALKGNPYFDYSDPEVEAVLQEFMNVLSRAIRIERSNFEPLLRQAVEDSITLAADPVEFLENELEYSAGLDLEVYFKGNKKYIKWHKALWEAFVQTTEKFTIPESLSMAFDELMDDYGKNLEPADQLLQPLQEVYPLEIERLFIRQREEKKEEIPVYRPLPELKIGSTSEVKTPVYEEAARSIRTENNVIDPALAWERFEQDEYGFVRGSVRRLSEDIGINQRFMFTRKLFSGNPELLNEALAKLDSSESFFDAVELLNQNFLPELQWDIDSEEVHEFLFLIFSKFEDKE
ncbi:hypothetical protein [Lunatibacter salilacus]|uniref:hypothetical protein n=1 Tax=Lunatibacter salilacus TaxID=2483804 RepID=UPI00131BD228|nr:hypothetical protein [Lunatibacter salilacus]